MSCSRDLHKTRLTDSRGTTSSPVPTPDQQVPTYGLLSVYDPELYRHQFNPPAAPQPPYTYTNSYALLRSPYAGPQNLLVPPYKPDRDQLHHGHQPIAYQQPPLTAAAAANLPHQNYQPVGQQRCTGKPPLGWPQPPSQHSPSCWCPPTAMPLPTAVVPISTPANGFVEIQHLPRPPQHAQFQIFAEPISDSSDVEMSIVEEVRTEELPPIESDVVHKNLNNETECAGAGTPADLGDTRRLRLRLIRVRLTGSGRALVVGMVWLPPIHGVGRVWV
ncbi:hypothetical protein SASPL_154886 [Salvia splendens]|uniref:Uncharacterized protein n=1 Tax=Salvia splendens TaxID=180675 RepID=A0A8X8W0V0_SALSN|nr:hypothetical protein SASPL_154886 [Salvia splendens]